MNIRLLCRSYVQASRSGLVKQYSSAGIKISPFIVQVTNGCVRFESKEHRYMSGQNMATSSSDSKTTQSSSNSDPKGAATRRNPEYKVDKEELKARLSPIQYQVTQLKSTER